MKRLSSLLYWLVSACLNDLQAGIQFPSVPDTNLELRLIAQEPDIVTPVGTAIDKQGRLFVIESHTHFPKPDYTGPTNDVVKLFRDTNGDGIPDTMSVFATGFRAAMNLAFAPDETLCLSWRNGVIALHDKDGDGVSESRTAILEMESASDYPHNGIHGLAFSPDGWLYIGMGENMAAKQVLKGTDGIAIRGERGEGRIFRCRPDGSKLEVVARGFWNPFGLGFDRAGRLFCVDNDPGGRPPCRLLHIIQGGNYGYQRMYEDLHPFNGWDGELPGTLPMLAGTGEAPCAVMDTDQLALPSAYRGALLVTSWGDAALELYRLQPKGTSFSTRKEVLVQGERQFNEAFCPVGLAAAPDGSLYITDWADRSSYPVHGKGRIWRLASRSGAGAALLSGKEPTNKLRGEEKRLRSLRDSDAKSLFNQHLGDADRFIQSAAVSTFARQLAGQEASESANTLLADTRPEVRLGTLLALREARLVNPESLRTALADPDEQVRFLALWWTAEEHLTALTNELSKAVSATPSPNLFNAYLAATEMLSTEPAPPGLPAKKGPSARDAILARILGDASQPPTMLAMAAAVANPSDTNIAARLIEIAHMQPLAPRIETIRTLAASKDSAVPGLLLELALAKDNPASLRAEAIAVLARRAPDQLPNLTALLNDNDSIVRTETARALRLAANESTVQSALRDTSAGTRRKDAAFSAQLDFALNPSSAKARPTSPKEWHKALAKGGDVDSGRRVFFHPLVNCAKCHQFQGRGAQVGPDLSTMSRTFDRDRLIDAILDPSREVAPQYEQHIVETKSGLTYTAVLVHTGLEGTLTLNAVDHGRVRVKGTDVTSDQISQQSLMPAGLEQTMTVEDFRDLLAFLLGGK